MTQAKERKITEELLDELLFSPTIETYVDTHDLATQTLAEYLCELSITKNLAQNDVINRSGLNYTYAYEILTGKAQHPSRDKVLPLVFALKCDLREAQRVLRRANLGQLDVKNRRDSIIMFSLIHHFSLGETDEELYRLGEATITDA